MGGSSTLPHGGNSGPCSNRPIPCGVSDIVHLRRRMMERRIGFSIMPKRARTTVGVIEVFGLNASSGRLEDFRISENRSRSEAGGTRVAGNPRQGYSHHFCTKESTHQTILSSIIILRSRMPRLPCRTSLPSAGTGVRHHPGPDPWEPLSGRVSRNFKSLSSGVRCGTRFRDPLVRGHVRRSHGFRVHDGDHRRHASFGLAGGTYVQG